MVKFKVTVTRINEYEIEFDDSIYDEKFIRDFKEVFYDLDTLQEHAEHIAQHRARFEQDFIEGYGIPLQNGKRPYIYGDKGEEHVAYGMNINIISEDDFNNMDIESEEIS